ncbi:MAG TPA: hypothetical protein VGM92_13425, partial [Candidatus Kapabacteria bacterium]
SKPKIGPAFRLVPVEGVWTRPKDNALIEVHAFGENETRKGRYMKVADILVHEERMIAKRSVRLCKDDENIETIYSNKTEYYPPAPPFAQWIRFRTLEDDGTPSSEWQSAPHHDEWAREDRAIRTRSVVARNRKRLEESQSEVRIMLKEETVPEVRLERLFDLLKESTMMGFDRSMETEGQGEFFEDCYMDFLEREFRLLERAVHAEPRGIPITPLYNAMTAPEAPRFDHELLQKARHFKTTDDEIREIFHKLREHKVKSLKQARDTEADAPIERASGKNPFVRIPESVAEKTEQLPIPGLAQEPGDDPNAVEFRFKHRDGKWYWGFVPNEWIGTELLPPPALREGAMTLDDVKNRNDLARLEEENAQFEATWQAAARKYYKNNPELNVGLPQTAYELELRALVEDDLTGAEEFQRLFKQYHELAEHERTLYCQARWRYLQSIAQDYFENFVQRDPEWAARYASEKLLEETGFFVNRKTKSTSEEQANGSAKIEPKPIFASVWIAQDNEYREKLQKWLLNGWCRYDPQSDKFLWRHALNDFGYVLWKVEACMTTDRRYPKLAEEWLFEKLPHTPTAKQIKDAYHKVRSSGEYHPSPQLANIPVIS